ncbi:MAG: tetratricopeptide (TPR) repeat protein, partial [Myxococcota bacterium]
MIPRLLVTVCLLTTATLTAVVPEAQAQDKLQQARQHFDRGTEFFRLGRYDEALDELMKAYVLDPNELLVYNIGRVHEERQDLANALKFFENYLKMNRRAKNRRDVKRRIRRLRKELKNRPAAGVLAVHSVPPGASVRLNGQLVGTTPIKARRMPPGRYRMELALPGFQVWVSDVMLSPGQTTRTDVKMVDPPFPVRITATPQGATATLIAPSRKPLGTCPCSVDLSAGRYRVRVEYPGFQEREFDFVKRPNEPMSLPVTLMPKQILGKLWVDANIPGA